MRTLVARELIVVKLAIRIAASEQLVMRASVKPDTLNVSCVSTFISAVAFRGARDARVCAA